jgi:hypothetical protein
MTPKEWFDLHPDQRSQTIAEKKFEAPQPKPAVHIPIKVLDSSLKDYEDNSFIQGLLNFFSADKVEKAVEEYYLGTAQSLTGANKSVVFWFIDRYNNIRAGQVKEFNQECKTLSFTLGEETLKAYWVHRLLKRHYRQEGKAVPEWLEAYLNQDKYLTCLFGEHLLTKYPNKPVGLVEAPKTAVIASIVYPEYLWLATTSLSYLTKDRCQVLKGRTVVLFPDCGIPNKKTGLTCLDVWRCRVSEFEEIANFKFSTLLEEATTTEQKEAGFDLADLLLANAVQERYKIDSNEITFKGETRTGREFNYLIVASVVNKRGDFIRVLFNPDGTYAKDCKEARELAAFWELDFTPALLDNSPCLININ